MIIGSEVISFEELESTNTHSAILLKQTRPREGTVIQAHYQSAGRGQKGNRWQSEKGKNLLFSIILYPDMIRPEDQFIISMTVSLGICDFLNEIITDCRIKWPNDIYAGNRKIAGILIENTVRGTVLTTSVAGIGLNLNQTSFPDDIPNPVSLKVITGQDNDLTGCLKKLTDKLDKRYKSLISGEADEIRNEYTSLLYRLGEWHNFKTDSGEFYGMIVSVTDSGCLQVRDRQMHLHQFSFKEIEFML